MVDFKDRGPGAKVMIEVHVIVEANSQRGIIIGAGGSALKALGSAARVDIEEFLGALLCCEDKQTLNIVCRMPTGKPACLDARENMS